MSARAKTIARPAVRWRGAHDASVDADATRVVVRSYWQHLVARRFSDGNRIFARGEPRPQYPMDNVQDLVDAASTKWRAVQALSEVPSRKILSRREGGLATRRTPRMGSTVAAAWQSARYILKAALANRSPATRCSSWGPRRRGLYASKRCLCRLRGIGVQTGRVSRSRRRSTHCPRCRRSTPSRIARCPRRTTFGTCPVETPRTWAATRWGRSTSSRRLSSCAGRRATRGTCFFSEQTKKIDISASACSIRRGSQFQHANSCNSVAANREGVPR